MIDQCNHCRYEIKEGRMIKLSIHPEDNCLLFHLGCFDSIAGGGYLRELANSNRVLPDKIHTYEDMKKYFEDLSYRGFFLHNDLKTIEETLQKQIKKLCSDFAVLNSVTVIDWPQAGVCSVDVRFVGKSFSFSVKR